VRVAADPYAALGVARGADDATIHAAYRAAVRRTHPDAGGSTKAFEAVQEAYELLRDPAARAAWERQSTAAQTSTGGGGAARPGGAGPSPRTEGASEDHRARGPADAREAARSMEDLMAESRRFEEEARRLAGLSARRPATADTPTDSFGAILRDASTQLRDAADEGARGLRRFIRRRL
jgi:curved DNA-binding protein CbpA